MVPIDPSRRRFLKTSSFAYAALGLGGGALGSPGAPSWISRPMRWAQLTLVEDDPGKFDIGVLARLLPRAPTRDAVCLSAGGCVAYYPTEVPFHHRSAWLGDRDLFGELVAGCRQLGMVVVARTDPHATYDDVQAAHPDWIAVDADRQAAPALGLARDVGHLRPRPLQLRVHDRGARGRSSRATASTASSSTAGPARACATASTAGRTSAPPPVTSCPGTRRPAGSRRSRTTCSGASSALFDLWQLWDAEVRKINPDSCVIPNTGGGASSRST